MDDGMKKAIREKEKRHKRYLSFYRKGKFFKNFFRYEQIQHVRDRKVCLFLIVMGVFYICFSKFWYALLGSLLVFIVLRIIGKRIYKIYNKKLYDLGQECEELYDKYYSTQCDAYEIHDGVVRFPDDVTVGNGYISTTMRKYYGYITICQLEKIDELERFELYKKQQGSIGTINDKIASVDFNEKYGVISECSEIESMKYFSPTVQVKMIKSSTIMNFSDIHIDYGCLKLKTKYNIALPTIIDIYTKKKLNKYFNEIDVYCKEMREMADEVYADYIKIDFLRGTSK